MDLVDGAGIQKAAEDLAAPLHQKIGHALPAQSNQEAVQSTPMVAMNLEYPAARRAHGSDAFFGCAFRGDQQRWDFSGCLYELRGQRQTSLSVQNDPRAIFTDE